nr:type I restriction enzyme endonuclease domain-containing protein [Arthrobacter sp. BE255]
MNETVPLGFVQSSAGNTPGLRMAFTALAIVRERGSRRPGGRADNPIKRLLVLNGYPPDKQPEAIKLAMEQMESMAPRFAEARA